MESLQKDNDVQQRPIPYAVLKIQFKKLVEQQSSTGQIYTKDLLMLIDQYERTEQVVLLTETQKRAILPYTQLNPDLEMTPQDILNLLKLVCPQPALVTSVSAPTTHLLVRPRTSSMIKSWKRRPSVVATMDTTHVDSINNSLFENNSLITSSIQEVEPHIKEEDELPTQIEKEEEKLESTEEYSNQEIAKYYRRSLKLTQRLKSSEKSLASITKDNEDRIVELQNKVEDMSLEVVKQRKEIQEYKGKERNSLEQISALESHILNIQRSETDQKQVYMSIKLLFDEKCQETHKLQELLRQKENDLQKTEDLLKDFKYEVELLSQERKRLIQLQNSLEQELETSAEAHKQLQEQKNENEKLKEIIDTLKVDLDEALLYQNTLDDIVLSNSSSTTSIIINKEDESHAQIKTLETELLNDEDERLKTVQSEKEFYKNRANEAMEDLGRVKGELDYLRKALDSENRALVNELAELKQKKMSNVVPPLSPSSSSETHIPLNIELDTIIPNPSTTDVWSHSRIRSYGNKSSNHHKRKRTVQDLHESSSSTSTMVVTKNKDRKVMTKQDNKIVANTVTFTLYTLLIYFFGIVTSTFLLDGSSAQVGWEQALVSAASGQVPKSKVLEIVLYWIEKLLFESEGLPIS